MKDTLKLVSIIPLLAAFLCQAQTNAPADQPGEDAKPASSNVPGQRYPMIDSVTCVYFRVSAPKAQKVQISIGQTNDMTKGADGFWTVKNKPAG